MGDFMHVRCKWGGWDEGEQIFRVFMIKGFQNSVTLTGDSIKSWGSRVTPHRHMSHALSRSNSLSELCVGTSTTTLILILILISLSLLSPTRIFTLNLPLPSFFFKCLLQAKTL